MDKAPTGIAGFDEITRGGLPRRRTTLVEGAAGAGKTVFALQSLVHGARDLKEPGIFVAFEESSRRIVENARAFGWDLPTLEREHLFLLDAQPDANLIVSGEFDLAGMLAAVQAKADAMGARRIVFDALDIVLALATDAATVRREAYRLHEWLLDRQLTGLITAKLANDGSAERGYTPSLGFMGFMVDCAVRLRHDLVDGVAQRRLRVSKFRGSGFNANEIPFVFGEQGLEVAYVHRSQTSADVATDERLTSGIEELDRMLGGGFFRGANILLTGAPGTAKTTLCGAFAEAACRRDENTLFVSFDSTSDEIVRNLSSVAIDLAPHRESGRLRMVAARALDGSAEQHLMAIKATARDHGTSCVIVDPLSAIAKSGNRGAAPSVVERLVDWAKTNGMTVMCSSLLDADAADAESTPLQISTIADTWIHLNYLVQAGERNRGLSIVKSRGTSHSNQVRELVLSDHGVTLTDVYTSGGEVLMGTMRWAREREDELAQRRREVQTAQEGARIQLEAQEIETEIKRLQEKLNAKRVEVEALLNRDREMEDEGTSTHEGLRRRRTHGSEFERRG